MANVTLNTSKYIIIYLLWKSNCMVFAETMGTSFKAMWAGHIVIIFVIVNTDYSMVSSVSVPVWFPRRAVCIQPQEEPYWEGYILNHGMIYVSHITHITREHTTWEEAYKRRIQINPWNDLFTPYLCHWVILYNYLPQ